LYFYLQNSAVINTVIFIYGIFLVVSHYNFRQIKEGLEEQYRLKTRNKQSRTKKVAIALSEIIKSKSRFPFVAGQISLLPRKTTFASVQIFVNRDAKWKKLVADTHIEFS